MGRIKKGILGGFSGKVGTVVGANWKSINYMRSLPTKVKNPRTLAQLKQRSRFTLVVNLLRPMIPLLRVGWKQATQGRQSAFNVATSYTLANAIVGDYPNYEIDPQKVMISRGTLTTANRVSASAGGDIMSISWENNSDVGIAKDTDKAVIAFLNPQKGEAIFTTEGPTRAEENYSVQRPMNWRHTSVWFYIGFISEDGKEISDSVYAGTIAIE